MWLLQAREKAEKIWYPVVWEEVKDADNVIDYDIRGEETKDASATINANNQTTTGMATVIPWVNAPKLLESTSIIKAKMSYFNWVISVTNQYTEHEDNPKYWTVITSTIWWNWLEIDTYLITFKTGWTFYLDIKQQQVSDTVVSWYRVTTYVKKNLQTFLEWHFPYWPTWFEYSWPFEASAWDTLGICGCIWNISQGRANAWQWPVYDISITQTS